jgi:hypothetical protein
MKYLELYKKWSLIGKIENELLDCMPNGLCSSEIRKSEYFELFEPNADELEDLAGGSAYWASEITSDEYLKSVGNTRRAAEFFTPTRQNIVLFIAFMEGEIL